MAKLYINKCPDCGEEIDYEIWEVCNNPDCGTRSLLREISHELVDDILNLIDKAQLEAEKESERISGA